MFKRERLRALVIDDEPSICKVLKRTLQEDGYEVATAGSRQDAEALVRTELFDLMIVDLRLGDCRGDEIFYFTVGHQPHLEKHTIFLTGDITEGGWNLISATGCPMILKPYNADELLNLCHSLLKRQGEATA